MDRNRLAGELVKLARELVALPRVKWERSMFIPSQARGAENVQKADIPSGIDLEIYTWEKDGVPYGVAFQGRGQKPLWKYRFRSERERDKSVQNTIVNRKSTLDSKKQRQKERQEFRHDYQVGDILYSSWGYDQTNVDFYEVVGIGEKSIAIRPIRQKVVKSSEGGADYVVPRPGRFDGPKKTKRVRPGGSIKIESYANAYKWDGKPKYQTAMGWGH